MTPLHQPDEKIFKGIIHIHTTFSFDGKLSLPDVIVLAKKRNLDFIVLTEHAEDLDDKKMQLFIRECHTASTDTFVVIPGLEFSIDNQVHILAVGIEEYFYEKDPCVLIRKIHHARGLAILAHTAAIKKRSFNDLSDLDLIEIWNPRYGEWLSPSIRSLKILYEFRRMKKGIIASGGLDLHKSRDFVSLHQEISSPSLTREAILSAIKRGNFITTNDFFTLPSLEKPAIALIIYICILSFIQSIPNNGKNILKKILKIFD